jgi:hypothetical protein
VPRSVNKTLADARVAGDDDQCSEQRGNRPAGRDRAKARVDQEG